MKIAVLGLGAMGSRMAANLIKAGFDVTVWNRSPQAMEALAEAGAKTAATPSEAAKGNEFVMTMVRDNEAAREVWLTPETGALAGMEKGTVAIESSTVTPEWIKELDVATKEQGVALLEAPVSGSTPQAEAAQLVYLVGGDEETLKRATPALEVMGSAIQHVGEPGQGALAKLATNTLLGTQVVILSELTAMLRRNGADVERIFKLLSATPVWSVSADRAVSSILSENFNPLFALELVEKDLGYTLGEAGGDDRAPTIAAARQVFAAGIEAGFGKEQMTAVVKLLDK